MLVKVKKEKDTGLTAAALKKSRKAKNLFLKKHGFIPASILYHDRSIVKEITDHGRELTESGTEKLAKGGYERHYAKVRSKMKKRDGEVWDLENTGLQLQGRTTCLSTFPYNIGRFMVNFYCPEDGIVYDPFAGHNSRMELVFRCQRHYVGVDVCKEYMEYNKKRRKELRSGILVKKRIRLITASSDDVPLDDNYADFTITSPPYWDMEYYGDEPEQLGNAETYTKFIDLLTKHIIENRRILKPDSWCIWFVNDFRRLGKFYAYHADVHRQFLYCGFEPHGIYIVDLGRSPNEAFVQWIEKHKILPKRHEYVLIYKNTK